MCSIANYTFQSSDSQTTELPINERTILVPSYAEGFVQTGDPVINSIYVNTGTAKKPVFEQRDEIICYGRLSDRLNQEFVNKYHKCPVCSGTMHSHSETEVTLRHSPTFSSYCVLKVKTLRRRCPHCGKVVQQDIPFKHPSHFITTSLCLAIIRSMDATGVIKRTAIDLGVDRNIVKEVHKAALMKLYCDEDGMLKRPEQPSECLGIDEWSLHKGHKMATVIIDLRTGQILWVQETKSKEVVRCFMDAMGDEFMSKVKVLACDMNADFGAAFRERYPNLEIVYDRFHIMKNYNDKVITPVRISEQERLEEEGRHAEAVRLKKSKYILTSSRAHLEQKDQTNAAAIAAGNVAKTPAQKGTTIVKPLARIFPPRTDFLKTYKSLIEENSLLSACDFVKEAVRGMYDEKTEEDMLRVLNEIIDTCAEINNKHFSWFGRLLKNHASGIITYAKYHLTSGKCEGIVNRIKTIRRACYGIADTDYFFLRLVHATRKLQVNLDFLDNFASCPTQ